ncbi:PD40 domain-containing protein [Kosmotoga pacifica]|uniref:Dipeptidylpeptidase IV N-terminal domain-containing protein n=1 Tax=Kosmotoga pacifica TaxID=1330330 RepID=A0A0G2ZCD6_9BACT|nr:PD40 domain-containing protein [Kosmotoga pacifica]AKI97766.1 hypothetical protein IX53_08020 [Kosmotoga pacifica]
MKLVKWLILIVMLTTVMLFTSGCGLFLAMVSGESGPIVLQGTQFEQITSTKKEYEVFPRLLDEESIIFTSVTESSRKIVLMNLKNKSTSLLRENATAAWPIPEEGKYVFGLVKNDGIFLCEGSLTSPAYTYLTMTPFATRTNLQPSVSPDGERIAFHFLDPSMTAYLGVIERNRPFYSVLCEGTSPTWSKDGKYIYADHELPNGNYEIIRIDVQNGLVSTILSGNNKNYTFPVVSPDGKWLAFQYGEDSIAFSDLYGGKLTVIVEGLEDLWSIHWGSDGFIYFSSKGDIYRIKPILPEE